MVVLKKHRLFIIDIVRIICALLIYMKHSITMYGCSYGYILDIIIKKMTGPV